MKEHFLDRLYGEYQAYRASLLSCPNIEIFNRCYEIDAVVNFYEILMEKAGGCLTTSWRHSCSGRIC